MAASALFDLQQVVLIAEKDEFMIQAIYQHDCSYPMVYPETANLSENFSEIRKQYMFDTNQ